MPGLDGAAWGAGLEGCSAVCGVALGLLDAMLAGLGVCKCSLVMLMVMCLWQGRAQTAWGSQTAAKAVPSVLGQDANVDANTL